MDHTCHAPSRRSMSTAALLAARADVVRFVLVSVASGGHTACLETLIRAKADVNERANKQTPAMAAAVGGQVDCLNVLIAAGACECGWGDDAQALVVAATNVGNIECLNALLTTITAGSDVNATGKLGQTLAVAAAKGNLDCLNALISARADLNPEGRYGLTPVAAAAKSGKIECLNV